MAILSCTSDSESGDGANDVGLGDGKADGAEITACEKTAIVAFVNEATSVADLEAAGINSTASKRLIAHRDGADGQAGTADDDLFDSIEEVDAVPYVGPITFGQLVAAVADRCVPPADPYADARDVTKPVVVFPPGTIAPTSYEYPTGTQGLSLGGTEFWQKWTGGLNPTYSFEEGTDAGRLCMQASAIRFTEIMKDPPPEIVQLMETTNWDGRFFNWNDDFSNASYDASAAKLWAWRTYLIKWISQTKQDGSCLLPTRKLVIDAAAECAYTAENAMGEIQGCSVSQF
ncbi:MAG: hypothetical protein AB7P03_14945 [Kofleriaceae bacterium]